MAPGAAWAVSPGCQAVIDGGFNTNGVDAGPRVYGRFVPGDVIVVTFTGSDSPGPLNLTIGAQVESSTANDGQLVLSVNARANEGLLEYQGTRTTSASCTPGPDVPVVQDSNEEFGVDSTVNQVNLWYDWDAAEATGMRISTAPLHGTATPIDHSTVHYTPDPGFEGTDTFQFVGTNQDGDSAPATVTINVVPMLGMLPKDGSALPMATVGQPYSFTFRPRFCVGTCQFSLSDVSFADGEMTIDPATGVLSGTPSSFNRYDGSAVHEVEVYVYDDRDLDGTNDDSTNYDFTMPIQEAVAPTASPSTTEVSANQSWESSLDLVYSGGVRSLNIAVPPQNGTAYVDGVRIYYKPNLNFRGTDQLRFTVSNNLGTSQPAVATIVVGNAQQGQIFPATGPLKDALVETPYAQQVEIVDKPGSTYILAGGSLPPWMTLDGATGMLSGTPPITELGQSYAFSVTGQGPDIYDYPETADYTLTVSEAQVTATDKAVEVTPGAAPLPVDLTAGATGGPFTDAAILSITPPDAGTAKLTMGEFAALVPDWEPGKFYLKFIPNPNFRGTAVVAYALRGSAGVSNNAAVTFTVPLAAAAIANQIDGQVRGMVTTRQSRIAEMIEHPGLLARRAGADGSRLGTVNIAPGANGVTMNFASSLAEAKAWNAAGDAATSSALAEPDPFNAWIVGKASLQVRNQAGLEYTGGFGLLSLGADYLLNERLLAGVALHIDAMDDISGVKKTEGKGMLVGPYMSTEVGEGVFFDASLLYGHSWNSVTNGFFSGNFETQRLLGKAKLEGAWQFSEQLTLRPDATFVLSNERVGNYTITNGLGDAITVAGFDSTQIRISAGGQLEYRLVLDNGLVLTPEVSGSIGYSATSAASNSMFGTLGTGLTLGGAGGWNLGSSIELGLDANGLRSATARANLGVRF